MSDVNLSISTEVVKPIIEAKIHSAIVDQLKGSEAIMESIVTRVLQSKVDSEGNPVRYGNGVEFVKWLCEDCIRKAATQAVVDSVEQMRPKLQALIVKDLEKRKGQIAEQLVGFFAENARSQWNVRTSVTIEAKK